MEYVYAAMLLHKAGQKVTEESLNKVLQAAGIAPNPARAKALVSALEGVDIDAAIKEASVVLAPVAPSAAPLPAQGAKKEEKKAEDEKKSAEQAAAGLGALFG